ncbi:hypothetical protein FUAX_24950 [Fulvitalea axinellae]|uniref:Uncharacterized protein n=1 Tax=Fulvitalea axinellae TaxID=1182444 RepID=A0AAU9CIY9_9BACT|nr:hypothetical protein FUAX_24950 [Fulvitalea axinellae]
MLTKQVTSHQFITPSRYPLLAKDMQTCQAIADFVTSLIMQHSLKALKSHITEDNKEQSAEKANKQVKELTRLISNLENNIVNETDPQEIDDLEVKLDMAKAQLRALKKKLTKGDSLNGIQACYEDLKQANNDNSSEIMRAAFIDYLNDYVVPGNLGEGTVTFEGIEYVAEAVTD